MSEATQDQLQECIDNLENVDYKCFFYLPDHEKPSGGIKLAYDHVKCMNENGFNGVIIHNKSGFKPNWLADYYDIDEDGNIANIPIKYLSDEKLAIRAEDFFFIPEGFSNIMQNLAEQGVPCKKIIFCQNWYYILNALPPGVFWENYGITDCMSVSQTQTEYINAIMPNIKCKNIVGQIDKNVYHAPEKNTTKKFIAAFIPSRDGGTKAHNVIKTFYALFPHLRFIQFKEIRNLGKEEYAETLRDSTFYIHFDEYSSWGTAPIEAFMSKCIVAGWDGVGGREYMSPENCWVAPNGDIFRLAIAIGNMIETYMMDDVKDSVWESMEAATMLYSKEVEKDSIIRAHNEYREERIEELEAIKKTARKKQEASNA